MVNPARVHRAGSKSGLFGGSIQKGACCLIVRVNFCAQGIPLDHDRASEGLVCEGRNLAFRIVQNFGDCRDVGRFAASSSQQAQ